MNPIPPVSVTVPVSSVLRMVGLPESWRCLAARYDDVHATVVLEFETPFDTVDRPQVFVEGDH